MSWMLIRKNESPSDEWRAFLKKIKLIAATKKAQQEEEQIDEIEIQRECPDDGRPFAFGRSHIHGSADVFYFLCVIRDQSNKYGHTYIADDPVKGFAFEEKISDRSNDDSSGKKIHIARQLYFIYELFIHRLQCTIYFYIFN